MKSISQTLEEDLTAFKNDNVHGKGDLAIVLTISENARAHEFPLSSDDFVTKGGGQVARAGGAAANKILKAHGITVRFSAEGGRTNRGSLALMKEYVAFLNRLHSSGKLKFDELVSYWISQIENFLATAPFKVKIADRQISLRAMVNDLISQAHDKQKTRPGSTITGTLMQHLTAAKLRCLLKDKAPSPHGASAADAVRDTLGDFEVNDSVIHVTAAPSELLLEKCKLNLEKGKRPIIVTLLKSISHAQSLAETLGIDNRIEFWSFDQFLSTNAHEWGAFVDQDVREQTKRLIRAYNDIITELNEEPSLSISV